MILELFLLFSLHITTMMVEKYKGQVGSLSQFSRFNSSLLAVTFQLEQVTYICRRKHCSGLDCVLEQVGVTRQIKLSMEIISTLEYYISSGCCNCKWKPSLTFLVSSVQCSLFLTVKILRGSLFC